MIHFVSRIRVVSVKDTRLDCFWLQLHSTRPNIVTTVRELALEPKCQLTGDMLDVTTGFFAPLIIECALKNGTPAYQLNRFQKTGDLIRSTVEKRLKGKRHNLPVEWRTRLDTVLAEQKAVYDPKDKDEELARTEKAVALKELAESRIAVLIGPAGTGKTTMLSALCGEPSVKAGGILLLAPTGKARVQLQKATKIEAQTLAQFLYRYKRYEGETGIYRITGGEKVSPAKTVIIDEASMLTEEQFGALLDALEGVERLILVGDPAQLPPIGAGRPFVDIVTRLKPDKIENKAVRVDTGYAELTVRRRQRQEGKPREDLQLAEWYSDRPLGPGEDEILSRALLQDNLGHVRFVQWDTAEDLRRVLLATLSQELGLKDINDSSGFEISLGGTDGGKAVFFNCGKTADKAEAWQILSPVRGQAFGVRDLNRLIQGHFRKGTLEYANKWSAKIPKPMGAEDIVYGDKVINVTNHRRYGNRVYPVGGMEYIANGEIGVVVGLATFNKNWKGKPDQLKVEFSTQPNFEYSFYQSEFKEEGNLYLELAYAVTVHKAQGSEFGTTFLILPNPCWLLSRELLYTALTRQKDKVVILHQGSREKLWEYNSTYYSETRRRLTNLFGPPSPIAVKDTFLEENLIHRSANGEPMRSKSEVIIANELLNAGVSYSYEQPLSATDGTTRYPDFTIEDAESGITYYWEHCGMLHVEQYRQRWEQKLVWYRKQNILPVEEEGKLIVTVDSDRGGIDSQGIKALIKKYLK